MLKNHGLLKDSEQLQINQKNVPLPSLYFWVIKFLEITQIIVILLCSNDGVCAVCMYLWNYGQKSVFRRKIHRYYECLRWAKLCVSFKSIAFVFIFPDLLIYFIPFQKNLVHCWTKPDLSKSLFIDGNETPQKKSKTGCSNPIFIFLSKKTFRNCTPYCHLSMIQIWYIVLE